MPRLAQTPQRYLHAPRLAPVSGRAAALYVIAWEGSQESVLQYDVGPDGSLGPERRLCSAPAIVTLTRGSRIEAADAPEAETEERRDGYRVWVSHEQGTACVWLARDDAPERRLLVFRGPGTVCAPTLARTAEGVWVAFHHDLREDTGIADVAKWIALRMVDADGSVWEPKAPMLERDRDLQGEQQSFEFPALVAGDDGALALFGRGSHNFYRQDLNAAGFGPRVALSDGQWGSRGRHIAAAAVRDGIVVARRDRGGIEVDLLPHVQGGAPELQRARVDWGSAAKVASGVRGVATADGYLTLFGDIQQHSAHSDGLGSAHEVYLRARYRYGDDFVALTDHESFLGKRTGPGEWEYLQRVAERYHEPGAFVALYAYEWTGKMFPGPGHKCVYYPTRGMPIISRDEVPQGRELVARVHALGGFASPHHIGWTGADEAGHDDVGQPLWEICSCHGCYEHVDHPLGQRGELRDQMADVMLQRGHRFGFTASSDSHGLLYHHGEARKRDPYRTGLTAVQARERTREAVMEALRARRCYATSGVKIMLDLRADGAPMGSALPQREACFEVHAVGTAEIAALELVGSGGVLARCAPASVEGRLAARVADRFVYARVVQRDGEMAWSSPVFLEGAN